MHLKRMMRRVFAFLTLLAMIIGLLPTVLFAEGEHELTLNGEPVIWDFSDSASSIYTDPYTDGSLTGSTTFQYHNGGHGASFSTNNVLTEILRLAVPEGETEVSLSLCEYSDADGQFVISYESAGALTNSIIPAKADTDGETASFTYSGDAGNIVISYQGGTAYLHSLTAQTVTAVKRATVSGTVTGPASPPVEGETLLFTAEDGSVEETVVSDGAYSIDLPVGKTYTVSFENSAVFGVTTGGKVEVTDTTAIANNIAYSVLWDSTKIFSFSVGGHTFTVTPGTLPTEDFSVTTDDDSLVELVTTSAAIVYANLGENGNGVVDAADLSNVSDTVTYTISENTITFTYTDASTSPSTFDVLVKDNSAAGVPSTDGVEKVYDFRDGEIVSSLYQNGYELTDGKSVKSSDGLLEVIGNNSVSYNDSQHGIIINNGDVVSVKVAGSAEIVLSLCQFTNANGAFAVSSNIGEVSLSSISATTSADGSTATVRYDGPVDETGVVTFTYSGSQGYLHSLSATSSVPVDEATVSGSVTGSSSLEGELLLFTGADGTSREAVITDGSYTVDLPVGTTYTVAFENNAVFGIISGGTIDLTTAVDGSAVTNNIVSTMLWDNTKAFSFTVSGRTFTVTPGAMPTDDFTVESSAGVELVTSDTAIVWAELGAGGYGTLTNSDIESVSDAVTYTYEGNTINFTYNDQTTSPKTFSVVVKDDSASGTPHADGVNKVYDFRDGSVLSELYQGNYALTDGASVSATDKLLTLKGNNRISYSGAQHGMIISNGDTISIKVAGNATITLSLCTYAAADGQFTVSSSTGEVSIDTFAAQAEDGAETSFTYTGGEGEVVLTYSGGSGYVHWLSVLNEAEETVVTEQEEMPSVQFNENLHVSYNGQTLTLSNTGGTLASGETVSDTVGYYGFDAVEDANRLEADVTVTSGGSSSANGVFVGVLTEGAFTTLGVRHGNNLRGLYTGEDGLLNAGGVNATVTEGETIHFVVERTEGAYTITATTEDGTVYSFTREVDEEEVSYGLVLAGVDITLTNMKYYGENGEILYDQNAAYSPIGTEPVITSVEAAATADRTGILVTWDCFEIASGDGRYVIDVKYGDGEWQNAIVTSDLSYVYPAELSGNYTFRVGGKLGNAGEVTYCDVTATVENYLPALKRPVLRAAAYQDGETGEQYIQLTWDAIEGAETYKVYRSTSEDVTNAEYVGEVNTTSYQDNEVELDVPYYYYVTAYSSTNSGNPSNTAWAILTGNRDTGEFAEEDDAAVLTFTKEPSDTVRVKAVDFDVMADRSGTFEVLVNETVVTRVSVGANVSTGIIRTNLVEGRNSIEFIFTDDNGIKTRQTFSIVCLSNIDMMVDSASTVEDGTLVDGIPTYKTVQAAVDAAPDGTAARSVSESDRTLIYVKAGDYEERLVVNKPNISLLGEDRDSTLIHCYPAELYPDDSGYEAGGDMTKRCAVYVTADADNFSAENISFANDYVYGTPDDKSNKSADALRSDADGAVFVNVKFSGVQDTLYLHEGSQYFYQCQIEGLIDFIYSGDTAKVLFEDCDIVFVHEETHLDSGYVCAPRTAASQEYGLVFNNCRITAEEEVVAGEDTHFRLARPWGPDGAIYWINCYMGAVVDKVEPYADMSGNAFMNARFYECGTYGPGFAIIADRRQISSDAANTILGQMTPGATAALSATQGSYIGSLTPSEPEPLPEVPEVTPTPTPEVTPAPEETVKPETTPSPSQPSDSHQNSSAIETGNYATPWIWAGVIVVAAAGIGAVLFMKKKKK